jgi:histone deacetylase 1/2
MDFRSKSCIFIGYSIGHQGYKCLDVTTGKIFISHLVVFYESIYPYIVPTSASLTPKSDPVVLPPNLQLSSSSALISAGTITQPPAPSQLHMISPSSPSNYLHDNSTSPASNPTPSHQQNNTDPAPSPSPPQQPVHTSHSMITRSKNNIHKPKILSNHHIRYPIPKALMTTLQPQNREPTCYSTAVKHHHWREAMNKEFDALLANGTWTLVPKP